MHKAIISFALFFILFESYCQDFNLTGEVLFYNEKKYFEIEPSDQIIMSQFENLVCGLSAGSLDLICASLETGYYFIRDSSDFVFINLFKVQSDWSAQIINYKRGELFSILSRKNGMKDGYSFLVLNSKIQVIVFNDLDRKQFEIFCDKNGTPISKRTYYNNESNYQEKRLGVIKRWYYRRRFTDMVNKYPLRSN